MQRFFNKPLFLVEISTVGDLINTREWLFSNSTLNERPSNIRLGEQKIATAESPFRKQQTNRPAVYEDPSYKGVGEGTSFIYYSFTRIDGLSKNFEFYKTPVKTKGFQTSLLEGVDYGTVVFSKGAVNSRVELKFLDFWADLTEKVALYSLPTYLAQQFIRIYECRIEGINLVSTRWHNLSGCLLKSIKYPSFDAEKRETSLPVKTLSVVPASFNTISAETHKMEFKGKYFSSVLNLLEEEYAF